MDLLSCYFLSGVANVIHRSMFDRPSPPRILKSDFNWKNKHILTLSQWDLQQLVIATGLKPVAGDLIGLPKGDLICHGGRYYPVVHIPGKLVICGDNIPILSYYPLNYWSDLTDIKEIAMQAFYNNSTVKSMIRDPKMTVNPSNETCLLLTKDGVKLRCQLSNQEDSEFPLDEYFIPKLEHDIEQAIGYYYGDLEHDIERDVVGLGEGQLSFDTDDGAVKHENKKYQLIFRNVVLYIPPEIPVLVSYNIYYWKEAIRSIGCDYGVILNLNNIPEKNNIYKQVLDNLGRNKWRDAWETHFTYSGNKIYIVVEEEIVPYAVSLLVKPIWWLRSDGDDFFLEHGMS